jgi:hypothetical protein
MKKSKNIIIILFVFTLGIFSSCTTFFKDGITGNGQIVTKEINIDSFNQLEVDGVFNIVFKQGDKEAITIESDENIAKLIRVQNVGNTLIVDYKENVSIRESTKLNIYITVVNITEIDLSIVGDVVTENILNQDNIEIINQSVGDVDLNINCESLVLRNSSVGDITISGHSNELDLSNSGVGDLLAQDFISNTVRVSNSGVGDVDIYANKSLDVTSSGVGDINYFGSPKSKNIKDNSVGEVTARY